MRYYVYLFFLLLFCLNLKAQVTGDLAFVGFNADGNDDFAIVLLADFPANTTVYFRDEEWNGTAFGTGEGSLTWNTGDQVIPAGTIVGFYNFGGVPAVTNGSISGVDMGISASGEGIFAYLGTEVAAPTVFLGGIANATEATGFGTLEGTGLIAGSTAILLPGGTDIAAYTGPRTGLDKNGFLAALNDMNNWIFQDASGDQNMDGIAPDVPFDMTSFSFSMGDNLPPSVVAVTIENSNLVLVRFNEAVASTSVLDARNFVFSPARTIDSINYNEATNTVSIFQNGFVDGKDYMLTVSNISDASGNVMTQPYVEQRLVFNTTQPDLLITEMMYNPPLGADSIEFIEIINAGEETAVIGGLEVYDINPGNGSFGQIAILLPEQELIPGEILLIAPDGKGANNFFNRNDFIDLGFIGNALGNGGEAVVIRNSLDFTIDSVAYDDATPWPTSPDGTGPSLERKNLTGDSNDPANWKASTILAGQLGGTDVFASPGAFILDLASSISFASTHSIFTEGETGVNIELSIDASPIQEVAVVLDVVEMTASAGQDFILASDTLVFPAGSLAAQMVSLDLPDNSATTSDRYFAISIAEVINGVAGDQDSHVVYIKDNDQADITGTEEISLNFVTSYAIGDGSSAEIVAFDSASQRLFVVNSEQVMLEILDFSNPRAIQSVKTIDMTTYGAALTSVAANNGRVVAVVDSGDFGNGKAVFFDTDGNFIVEVEVGNLPDMVTFTPDGNRVVTANEGQPSNDYMTDPEGTISVIDLPADLANLKQEDVTTIGFNAFDGDLNTLKDSGVRIFGPNATVSKDLEPEYVAISPDGKTAWIACQENNAVAVADLENLNMVAIAPLGYKDHSLPENSLDASDQTSGIVFGNFPILGMYQPDAIATFTVGGKSYIISANEGDAREYDELDEAVRFGALNLDSIAFPNGDYLKANYLLGRINVTNTLGDFDEDGDYDAAYAFGARSFSIWDENANLIYDSGNLLERITASDPKWSALFNASNSNNNFKNRSDDKGPEPEGVTTAVINDQVYAFIALERIGGVMVFNVTNPQAPAFVQYVNSRELGEDEAGDLGSEGIIYINAAASPSDSALVVLANEVSGTISVWSLGQMSTSIRQLPGNTIKLIAFPNPTSDILYFEAANDYQLFDVQGKVLKQVREDNKMSVSEFSTGTYFVVRKDGAVAKVMIQR